MSERAETSEPDEVATSAEREIAVLKDVIRALLPDRHAVGRIAGEFGKVLSDGAFGFNVCVSVPLDTSDDESVARVLAAELKPALIEIRDSYANSLERTGKAIAEHYGAVNAALAGLRAARAEVETAREESGDRRDWSSAERAECKLEAIDSVIEILEKAKAAR